MDLTDETKVQRLGVSSQSFLCMTKPNKLLTASSQKTELGRHAFETRMPTKIHTIISQENDTNNTPNIIPILANLLQTSQDVEVAYLCNSSTIQISKLPSEGAHFCGYRNIQMLWLGLHAWNNHLLSSTKPSIPEIQEMIEAAWDAGINSHGKSQTGGVKGTRKHIGTSEVCLNPLLRLLTYSDEGKKSDKSVREYIRQKRFFYTIPYPA